MGLEIRHEDGKTAFVCSRGPSDSPEQRRDDWIAEEALRQNRCPLCLSLIRPGGCGIEKALCQGTPVSAATAVGILRGMVVG